jgi:hypothetical protein
VLLNLVAPLEVEPVSVYILHTLDSNANHMLPNILSYMKLPNIAEHASRE